MPEGGIIRPARPEDAAVLLEIYAPYVEKAWVSFEYSVPSLEEFQRRIIEFSQNYPYLVYEQDGEILGYAYAHRHMERAAYNWNAELSVYVREDCGGRGVGTALYGALIPRLRERGLVNLYAVIALPNPGSEAIHRKFGFQRLGVYPKMGFKMGDWRDVVEYGLRLRPDHWQPDQ